MKKFFFFMFLLNFHTMFFSAEYSPESSSSPDASSSDDDYGREIDKVFKPGLFDCKACVRKENKIGELMVCLGNRQIEYENKIGKLGIKHQKALEAVRVAALEQAKKEHVEALSKQGEQFRSMAQQTGKGVQEVLKEKHHREKKSLLKKIEEVTTQARSYEVAILATVLRIVQGESEDDEFNGNKHQRFLENIQTNVRNRDFTLSMLQSKLAYSEQEKNKLRDQCDLEKKRADEFEKRSEQQDSEITILRFLRPAINPNLGILSVFGVSQKSDLQAEPEQAASVSDEHGDEDDTDGLELFEVD